MESHPAKHLKARKIPTQTRAEATVTTILEAAAQVLATRGYQKTTTNHIAERSGFSVGTIYEYFPNKDVLFTALQSQWNDICWEHVRSFEMPDPSLPLEDTLDCLIEHWVSTFKLNPPLYAVLVNELPTRGNKWKADERLTQAVYKVSSLLKKHQDRLRIEDFDLAAEILVRGIQSYLDHVAIDSPACFDDPDFHKSVATFAYRSIVRDEHI